MTTYIWSGSGSASTATNWTPNGTPASGDTVQFGSTSVANCTWDLAVVSIMTIDATYTGTILMNTNCVIEKGLSIGSENCLNSTTATTISFTHATPQYKGNKVYIENNVADPFQDGTAKNFLQFSFSGTSVVPQIDAGVYPHMNFEHGFRPEYIAPTRIENEYTVQMESIFLGGQNVSPSLSIPTPDDRLMNWIITNHTGHVSTYKQIEVKTGTLNSFDAGYGTWTLQSKTGGHTIPVSGNPLYNGWLFTWRNMIIACDKSGVGAGFCLLPHSTILSLTNLTINEGAGIKGSDSKGGTIHLVNRPNIKGTWGFFPIADGIYHYKGLYNNGVANGGTGLITVPKGNILFGDDAQLLGNSANFNYALLSNTLSVGIGGIIIPAHTMGSPAANQLWVNSADSNKLYFGSSEVGSGGGGGGGTVNLVSNVATNTILGRNDTGSGDSEELTPAEVRTMLGIEAGATADQTNAEIRTAVEAATDSNVFTDADHTKLNGIATGATAYTDADAISAVESEATLALTGDVSIAAGKGLTVDTNTLHVDATNNRVGIGQASPATTLHVEATGTAIGLVKSSGGHANLRVDRASNSYDAALLFYTGGSLGWRIQESGSGNDLYIIDQDGSPDTARMRFHDAGTVEVSQAFQQGTVASAVLVADANGVLTAASALQDLAYLAPTQAEGDRFTPTSSTPFWASPPNTIQEAIDRLAAYAAQEISAITGAPPIIP